CKRKRADEEHERVQADAGPDDHGDGEHDREHAVEAERPAEFRDLGLHDALGVAKGHGCHLRFLLCVSFAASSPPARRLARSALRRARRNPWFYEEELTASAKATRSSLREPMSSFWKTWRRCHSTVRGLRKSSAPISGFVRPSRARAAICASWAVSCPRASSVRFRGVAPVASSSRAARPANPSAPIR